MRTYEKYIKENCHQCKNKDTVMCEIRTLIDGSVECINFIDSTKNKKEEFKTKESELKRIAKKIKALEKKYDVEIFIIDMKRYYGIPQIVVSIGYKGEQIGIHWIEPEKLHPYVHDHLENDIEIALCNYKKEKK